MKKVRFGLIGTNFITDWILEAAREESRFEAMAICSRKQETGQAFADKHRIPYVFTSPEAMAACPYIDAVYIASPNYLHASLSILFMQKGKHVLCEKPFASNAREARQMIHTAREKRVTLMEAMKPTLTPNFLNLQKHLSEAGSIRRYFASYCQYSSRYDSLKAGIVPNAFNPSLSNGGMMDLGVYTIYPMVVLFGRPKRIQASGLLLPTGVDAQGAVNFEYDQLNATILYSKISPSLLPTEIQGEAGTFTLDRIHSIRTVKFTPRGGESQDRSLPLTHHEYYYELAEFIRLIENQQIESPVNSLDHSLATLEIVDEVRKQLGVIYPADKY